MLYSRRLLGYLVKSRVNASNTRCADFVAYKQFLDQLMNKNN